MKSAVFATGGKQYFVSEGDTLTVERLPAEPGKTVRFADVLLTAVGEATQIGAPLVKDAAVEAVVLNHGLGRKVMGVKMKAKKRYRRLFGHRQPYSKIEIKKIEITRNHSVASGAAPATGRRRSASSDSAESSQSKR